MKVLWYAHTATWLIGSLVIWSEYVIPSLGLPRITVEPFWTLLFAAAPGLGRTLFLLSRAGRLHAFRTGLIATIALYIIAVLFGSPLISRNAFAWALYVAWSFCTLETRDVLTFKSSQDVLFDDDENDDARGRPTVTAMALLGSFVGCFVIPLDWDRPYQPFPIGSALVTSVFAPMGAIILMQSRGT